MMPDKNRITNTSKEIPLDSKIHYTIKGVSVGYKTFFRLLHISDLRKAVRGIEDTQHNIFRQQTFITNNNN